MKLLIVGAGQAGAWAARTARKLNADIAITLVGAEADPPYERPPLSKAYLAGQAELPALLSAEDCSELNIDLKLNTSVAKLHPAQQTAELTSGEHLHYDRLILTTGGRARLPAIDGIHTAGVHTLRTRHDADRLRSAMRTAQHMLIIGGGWIGLEVAATARELGLHVTLLEQDARLCSRTVPPQVSEYLLNLHRTRGVNVLLQTRTLALKANASGQIHAITNQNTHTADLIVVGAGLEPNVELAAQAGLQVANGILVDHLGRTSWPNIFAAGDVANQPLPGTPEPSTSRLRLETWANAQQQGIRVAYAALDLEPEPTALPWFWSDQYQHNIQVLGCPDAQAPVTVRGSVESHDACLYYWAGSSLQSVVAINRPRELKLAKRLIQSGQFPSPEELADPNYTFGKSSRKAAA